MNPGISRRTFLAGVVGVGIVWLANCAPSRRTPVSGWQDGLPSDPEPFPDDGTVCDMAPMLPQLALSPTGARVAMVAAYPLKGFAGLTVWDTSTGQVVTHTPQGGDHLQFLAEDDLLLTNGSAVIHHRISTGANRWFGTGHTLLPMSCSGPVGITSLAVVDQNLVTVGRDGYLGVFQFTDASRSTWRHITGDGYPRIVTAQGLIALDAGDSPIAVFDVAGEHQRDLAFGGHRMTSTGQRIVVHESSETGTHVVDLITGESSELPALPGENHATIASPMLLTSLSSRFTTDGTGPTVTVTDTTTLTQVSFELPTDAGDAVSLPNGEVLISDEQGITAWDPAQGTSTRRFTAPN